MLLDADFDWAGAEAEYRRAVQLAPNDATSLANLGTLLATLCQPDQAVALTRQALATDPLNASSYGLPAPDEKPASPVTADHRGADV